MPPGSLYSGVFARADVAGALDELYAAQLSISYDDASTSRIAGGAPGIENYDGGVKYDAFGVYAR